ncbi:MAG TPA: hypothetical protein VK939_08480 [Longimicrobiales bacterium]|nr:hypothetical protein [Longimicrobiales bacterium]
MINATLRAGTRRLAIAAALVLAPAVLPAQELPAAADVMAKYNQAIGGEAAFAKLPGMHSTGTYAIPAMGLTGELEVFTARPNLNLVRINVAGMGEITQGYDGETAWATNPMQGPRIITGEELKQITDEAHFDSALRLIDKFQSAETVEQTEMAGQACYRVRLVWPSGRESFECYSVDTGLIVGSTAKAESEMGTVEATSLVQEYREFDGITVPTKTVIQIMGMEQVLTITAIEFVAPPATTFELPADIRALKN